ncbi:hypothetical protein E4U54_001843 [Claviceps lovelessii]|nr:hypothetical protein E4U54_001843 [Claviceps lovelessii]
MASRTKTRKVTPPSPTYMSNSQVASYLSDLRSNRTARPGGARPLPPSTVRSALVSGAPCLGQNQSVPPSASQSIQKRTSQASSTGSASLSSRHSTVSMRGRDYYPSTPSQPLKPSEVVPTATYMERGQRWMEKEEASSLRDAMEEMDIRNGSRNVADEEESRIYNAALDEAAELVWQHEHGVKPPKPDGPYRYRPHLRRNSYAHARTASVETYEEAVAHSASHRGDTSSRSAASESSDDGCAGKGPSAHSARTDTTCDRKPRSSCESVEKRPPSQRRSSLKRNIGGQVQRPFSGDQIWEEPEAAATATATATTAASAGGRASPDKLNSRPRNPFNRRRAAGQPLDSMPDVKPMNRVEIYRNPPTQSRNPLYTTNSGCSRTEEEPETERKNGVEIRSDDIRAATSRKLKDRSIKLPEPTAVSDSPGRPIVSFDRHWKAPEETTDDNPDRSSKTMAMPRICIAEVDDPSPRPEVMSSRGGVPSISITGGDDDAREDIPAIKVPTISVNNESLGKSAPAVAAAKRAVDSTSLEDRTTRDTTSGSSRPLPTPSTSSSRNVPGTTGRAQLPRGHWSPAPGSVGRPKPTCHECGFPIESRFVALAGTQERFHPQCFSCYCCGTSLEAMEISPEPDLMRKARLERIRRRAAGEALDEVPGMTAAEDGDDRLRFYCHLDWHELFAPRCKHCKTPIIGEHVVALGDHWHYGHFFCAECGDPFEHGMTHIEKDGYAWCIKCQTKRTERRAPKCKMCKTAVIGQYIRALGGEWHEHCFRCADCDGGFDDGQMFTKEVNGVMVVLCTDCRTRDLKQ